MNLHLSYFSEKRKIDVQNEVVVVKAYQIIVWVSLTRTTTEVLGTPARNFPAILDIGTTHHFALTEAHLMRWTGMESDSLPGLGTVRLEGERAPLLNARLWLHSDAEPFKLVTTEGIAVFKGDWPRLPVLGLRALTANRLQTFIYGDTKQVLIRTPPRWYWPF